MDRQSRRRRTGPRSWPRCWWTRRAGRGAGRRRAASQRDGHGRRRAGAAARRGRPRPDARRSVAARSSPAPAGRPRRPSGVDPAPLRAAPSESAFWTAGSASPDELADEARTARRASVGARRDARGHAHAASRASVEPTSRRSMRRVGVDELLQLRPAEGLGEDAARPHLGEGVDLDPVRPPRAARRRISCHERSGSSGRRAPQAGQREQAHLAVLGTARGASRQPQGRRARRLRGAPAWSGGSIARRSGQRRRGRPRRPGDASACTPRRLGSASVVETRRAARPRTRSGSSTRSASRSPSARLRRRGRRSATDACAGALASDVKVLHLAGLGRDEVLRGLDLLAHQRR